MAVEGLDGKIQYAHPMSNGEKPSMLFSTHGPGHWCETLLTMHHLNLVHCDDHNDGNPWGSSCSSNPWRPPPAVWCIPA